MKIKEIKRVRNRHREGDGRGREDGGEERGAGRGTWNRKAEKRVEKRDEGGNKSFTSKRELSRGSPGNKGRGTRAP